MAPREFAHALKIHAHRERRRRAESIATGWFVEAFRRADPSKPLPSLAEVLAPVLDPSPPRTVAQEREETRQNAQAWNSLFRVLRGPADG